MKYMSAEDLVRNLLDNDQALLETLRERGIIPVDDEGYEQHHCEDARVAHVLMRELDVNIEGVEIILRMRRELLETRQHVATLLITLRRPDS